MLYTTVAQAEKDAKMLAECNLREQSYDSQQSILEQFSKIRPVEDLSEDNCSFEEDIETILDRNLFRDSLNVSRQSEFSQ